MDARCIGVVKLPRTKAAISKHCFSSHFPLSNKDIQEFGETGCHLNAFYKSHLSPKKAISRNSDAMCHSTVLARSLLRLAS